MRNLRVLTITVCLAGFAGVVAAQTPPPGGAQGPVNPPPGARAGQRPGAPGGPAANANQALQEVQEFWDTLVLNRAKSALQMDDTQYFAFWKQMRQLQQVRQRHQMERRRVINHLAQLLKPEVPTDEAALTAQTKALDDLEAQMFQEEQKALTEIDKVLTAYQRARFRVFEENMERQKLDLLARALNGGGGAPPAQGPQEPRAGGRGR